MRALLVPFFIVGLVSGSRADQPGLGAPPSYGTSFIEFPGKPAPTASSDTKAAPPAPPVLDGHQVMERNKGQVYRLKTAISPDAVKTSYGSCFVVESSGVLATNYHVIAPAALHPERYQIFLERGGGQVPAKIIAIDAAQDLALVRVESSFERPIPVRTRPLEAGERLYSVGIPRDLNLSIVEGNYNGDLGVTFSRKYQMSNPLNAGMSGGPTLDSTGALVGVNVSVLVGAESISFAVPAHSLMQLIERARASRELASSLNWRLVIQEQAKAAERLLHEKWLGNSRWIDSPGGKWKILEPPSFLKCWNVPNPDRDDKTDSGPINTQLITCSNVLDGITVRQDVKAASVRYALSTLHHARPVPGTGDYYRLNLASDWVLNAVQRRRKGEDSSRECSGRIVRNRHDVALHVSHCIGRDPVLGDLRDVSIRIATLDPEKEALVIGIGLGGFDPEQAVALYEAMIDSIRRPSG